MSGYMTVNAGSSGGDSRLQQENLYLLSGPKTYYEVKETKNEIVMRVDIPGCCTSDLRYWVVQSNVHFLADERNIPEYQHSGRKYGGSLVFNSEHYLVEQADAKLVNGVLWVTVPKISGIKANLDVIQKVIIHRSI